MTTSIYEKCNNKEGARPYKCRDYSTKISMNLQHFKRDGRFCDIDLISGKTRIKVQYKASKISQTYFILNGLQIIVDSMN